VCCWYEARAVEQSLSFGPDVQLTHEMAAGHQPATLQEQCRSSMNDVVIGSFFENITE
jgi:hypothetical protein